MAVKPLVERKDFDSRDFFTDVEFYVNGKLIPFDGCTAFGDVGHVLSGVCRKVNGFEDWIREYMNNLDISDVDSWDTDELCYWFAYEMDQDFNDSYDNGFYLDGSGIVYDGHGVRVEAFEKEGVDEAMVKRIKGNKTVKEAKVAVNGRPRGLSPQYDSRKSFYNKANVVDDNDGNMTLYSYNTPVCRIQDGKVQLLPKWDYSATTLRHVKEFLLQNGFEAGTKSQIAKRYSVVEESKVRTKRTGRSLKEAFDGGYEILASTGWVTMHEDSYENGEGKFVNEWDIDIRGTYSSMQDFIKAVQKYEDVPSDPDNWGIFDGRLITNFLADSDSISANDREIEAWKRGEETLYLVDVNIPVKLITTRELTDDDADMLGVSVW